MDDLNIVPEVDYKKTITKQKLVYTFKGWFKFDYLLNLGLLIFLSTGVFYVSAQALVNGEPLNPIIIVAFLFFAGLLISFFYSNALVKVIGKQTLVNKEDAINSLKFFYGDLTFDASSDNILRDVKPQKPFTSGRCITVIFYNENVYFHIATLGKGNTISLFSVLFNYLKCEDIARHFEKLQNEATQTSNSENNN